VLEVKRRPPVVYDGDLKLAERLGEPVRPLPHRDRQTLVHPRREPSISIGG
jgi:hypothetical protein